jgi:hypothetical protein
MLAGPGRAMSERQIGILIGYSEQGRTMIKVVRNLRRSAMIVGKHLLKITAKGKRAITPG